jgi:uncharacterized protein (DUF1697 family)
MSVNRFVALLRGINVGGRNLISMADLRDAFEAEGYGGVGTYIQTGNVLFETDAPRASLEGELSAMLERRLGVSLVVVVRSRVQMRNVIRRSPVGFGEEPERFHSDVVFLKAPLTAPGAMRVVELREGVDRAWTGPGVLYFARLSERRAQSRMSRIVGTPEYRLMTIRNWRTTTKLHDLLEER